MPISEDTVTTSSQHRPPAVPDEGAENGDGQTPRPSGAWEEPHPGQRHSITVPGDACPGAASCNLSCNGAGKVGMAAKAYSPYPGRAGPGGARRFAPPRFRRPASLRPHKIPQHTGSARLSVDSNTASVAPLLARSNPQTSAVSLTRSRASANGFSPAASDPSSASLSASEDSRRYDPITMTDFSGFLQSDLTTVATTANSDASSLMSLDMGTPPLLSPADGPDPYGWEAELDKRLHPGMRDVCSALHYQRASGAKRTLLKRVLSFGPAARAS